MNLHNRCNPALLVLTMALAWPATADDLDDLDDMGLPVVRNDDGYALAVTAYEATTSADLFKDDPAEHEVSLEAFVQPPDDSDGAVLCFLTRFEVLSAEDDRGRDQLLPQRRKNRDEEYGAVLPVEDAMDRRGRPMHLASAELDAVTLDRPGYEIEALTVELKAVVVEDREQAEVPASVVDVYHDIGHDVSVRVSAMEISDKGEMTVKMDLRRNAGEDAAVLDSLYAINADGDVVGGGRWTNEVELFSDSYELELSFPLNAERGITALRVVLATDYDVETVAFKVEDLFRR